MDGPARAGRYRIDGLLGDGGFSTVWLGYDEELDASVAVKILGTHWAGRKDVRNRFLQEARLLRRADSHLLVQVFDVGELPDGRPYFVMSHADRGTLEGRLPGGPLPLDEIVHVAGAVADGLTVLHDMGVVHRDVKPSNVLIRTSPSGGERLLLSDLGAAKQFMTAQGMTAGLGTVGYAAPEQMPIGQDLDARADVYGLGALVYHLLAGRPPAPYEERILPGAGRADVPKAVGDVVMKAIARDREDRWPSARAFADALSAAAAPPGDARPGRRAPARPFPGRDRAGLSRGSPWASPFWAAWWWRACFSCPPPRTSRRPRGAPAGG
ncbi:hypothetical protein GCM10022226_21680 [Sphaerisporangium flaviroseum]|uniref:non-specific serine/threonine protein kinase n=1 Tax=Sphaerisporangium flaviroseum TaxID=509199 RepID=A0ABP7HY66_9ACTN